MRTVPIVLFVLFAAPAAFADEVAGFSSDYRYSLSWSDFDPAQQARPQFAGVDSVWLWTECVTFREFDRLELQLGGTLTVVQFFPAFGVQNLGTADSLDLRFSECGYYQSVPIGHFVVLSKGDSAELCIPGAPQVWPCGLPEPAAEPAAWIGCCTGVGAPCEEGWCGPIDFVVPESWSRVKAEYR